MYTKEVAARTAAKHLPSLEALHRLEAQMKEMVSATQENRPPNTRGWLSGQEVDAIVEQIARCLKSPAGFDLGWLLLPHLIEVVKTAEKSTAPP